MDEKRKQNTHIKEGQEDSTILERMLLKWWLNGCWTRSGGMQRWEGAGMYRDNGVNRLAHKLPKKYLK